MTRWDTRLMERAETLLEFAVATIDPTDDRYERRYVCAGKPVVDCSQIVVFFRGSFIPIPVEGGSGRASGTVFESELHVQMAACCEAPPELEDGTYVPPPAEELHAFAADFYRDAATLWSKLNKFKVDLWGTFGIRCDDPCVLQFENDGLCYTADVVVSLPIIPIAICDE